MTSSSCDLTPAWWHPYTYVYLIKYWLPGQPPHCDYCGQFISERMRRNKRRVEKTSLKWKDQLPSCISCLCLVTCTSDQYLISNTLIPLDMFFVYPTFYLIRLFRFCLLIYQPKGAKNNWTSLGTLAWFRYEMGYMLTDTCMDRNAICNICIQTLVFLCESFYISSIIKHNIW